MVSGFFALLDDMAMLMDDIAVHAKVAGTKTAGVIGDDLALNANQIQGHAAERELPVVWAVTKGSLINKAILVPLALVLSAISTVLVQLMLLAGGIYLCLEGAEKVFGSHAGHDDADDSASESDKIKGAIRTDFVLSAEIIVISLGTVVGKSLAVQVSVLSVIALLMTVGVYGVVALIVKMDDIGIHMHKNSKFSVVRTSGLLLVSAMPNLLKLLMVVGTVAMFVVGGGIMTHLVHLHDAPWHLGALIDATVGVIAGFIAMHVVGLVSKLRAKKPATT